jgi:putative transposase
VARSLRIDFPGAWHHVTGRGNERRIIFRSDADRRHWLELVAQLPKRFGVLIHGYVLMPNHYHLIVESGDIALRVVMQWLNVSYTVWFNRRHGRVGHLFQGRYKAVLVEAGQWGLQLSRYVHLNPVRVKRLGLGKADQGARRVGLAPAANAEEVARRLRVLQEFAWSSYRTYCGLERAPQWLQVSHLRSMAAGPADRQPQNYRRYVEEAIRDGIEETPWESLRAELILGGEKLRERIDQWLVKATREHGRARHLLRCDFDLVRQVVSRARKQSWEEICRRHGDWARDAALWLGRTRCGLTLRELGERAGGMNYPAVGMAVRRWEARMKNSRPLAKAARQMAQLLNVEI